MGTKCKYCNKETEYQGTNLCDGCWELKHRIEYDIDLAKQIITELEVLNNDS